MEDTIDLFEQLDTLPQVVQVLINGFNFEDDAYAECKKLEKLLMPYGYIFDWGLSGEPFNLRRVSECEIGDWAFLNRDSIEYEGLESNYGMVMGFSSELINGDEFNYYAHLTLKNGQTATVYAHELKKLY
jgi:hypothetical protein